MSATRAEMIDFIHYWMDYDVNAAERCSEIIFNSYSKITDEQWVEIVAILKSDHIPQDSITKYVTSILENLDK